MTTVRDTQKQRVYRAENETWNTLHGQFWQQTIPNHELEAYVSKILAKRAIRSRWGARHIRVTLKRGGKALAHGSSRISLPAGGRNPWVICHEVAHCLTPSNVAGHGPEYAGIYLFVVKTVLGAQAAAALRASFKEHRVRISNIRIPAVRAVVPQPHQLGLDAVKAARKPPVKKPPVPRRPGKAAVLKAATTFGIKVVDYGGDRWNGYEVEAEAPDGWWFAADESHYQRGYGDTRSQAWSSLADCLVPNPGLERCVDCCKIA